MEDTRSATDLVCDVFAGARVIPHYRVCVTGGRDFKGVGELCRVLDALKRISVIIHGGARGADALAGMYASSNGIKELVFPADWSAEGPAAGPIRNQRMLEDGKPDVVVAMKGGAGTADCVRRAQAMGIPIVKNVTEALHFEDEIRY